MNGPAYALVGFVVAVGVFTLVSGLVRYRRQRRFWTRRHTWAHVTLTALWLVTIALIFISAKPGPQPKLSAFVQAVTMTLLFSGMLNLLLGQRRRRLAADGLVECAIRPAATALRSHTGRWQHGVARARPSVLEFRAGGPGAIHILRGQPREIRVLTMQAEGRRPSLRQIWSINPTLHIAVLQAPGGDLELAASAADLVDLQRDLLPPAP